MKKKYAIGIDVGGTNLKIGLLNSFGKILYRETFKTYYFSSRDSLINAFIQNSRHILKDFKIGQNSLAGIGIGLPGAVDVKNGVVHYLTNIQGWRQVPLRNIIQKELGTSVYLDNDVNAMTLAELKFGAAKGKTNAVCITLGTGVGGGIIIDGRLYRGSSFAAGEVGHIPIVRDGLPCNCGGRGCLETFVGNKYILQKTKGIFGHYISLEQVDILAKKGSKKAIQVWQEVGQDLGIALVGVINLLNPEVIVIGGGISRAGKLLFDNIRSIVQDRAMNIQKKTVKIVKAKLDQDAGLIGAGILPFIESKNK